MPPGKSGDDVQGGRDAAYSAGGPASVPTGALAATGELGRIDATGAVTVVDRLKELIEVDGFQVAPAELEALLIEHPDVADAGVVGCPDERHGQVPVAFVVPARQIGEAALAAWLAERVAPYKRPRRIHRRPAAADAGRQAAPPRAALTPVGEPADPLTPVNRADN